MKWKCADEKYCRKLRELGVRQDKSEHVGFSVTAVKRPVLRIRAGLPKWAQKNQCIAAYDGSELAIAALRETGGEMEIVRHGKSISCSVDEREWEQDDTIANILAKSLITDLEGGHITADEVNRRLEAIDTGNAVE